MRCSSSRSEMLPSHSTLVRHCACAAPSSAGPSTRPTGPRRGRGRAHASSSTAETLPRFVPTDEEHRGELRRRRHRVREAVDLDAVPQHVVVRRPSSAPRFRAPTPTRRRGPCRRGMTAAHRRPAPLVQQLARRVERADHRPVEPDQRAEARPGHRRFVQVHEVRVRSCATPPRVRRGRAVRARSARPNRSSSTRRSGRRRRHRARAAGRRTARRCARRRRAGAVRARARAPGPARHRGGTSEYGRRHHDPHASLSLRSHSRSLGQFGCSRCHCSGAARISASNSWASTCVMRATSSRNRPSRCDRDRRPHDRVVVAAGTKVDRGRAAASPRCAGRGWRGRPAASCARRRTRPRRRRRSRSRSLSRHTMRLSRSAWSTRGRDARARAGRRRGRTHSRCADEPLVAAPAARSVRRPRACDGPGRAIHAAAYSQPPRCGRARITPLPRVEPFEDVLVAVDREVVGDLAATDVGRQAQHLEPVARRTNRTTPATASRLARDPLGAALVPADHLAPILHRPRRATRPPTCAEASPTAGGNRLCDRARGAVRPASVIRLAHATGAATDARLRRADAVPATGAAVDATRGPPRAQRAWVGARAVLRTVRRGAVHAVAPPAVVCGRCGRSACW